MTVRIAQRALALLAVGIFAVAMPLQVAVADEGHGHDEATETHDDEEGMHDEEETVEGSDRMKGDVRVIEIVVSEEGFNGDPEGLALRLNEGETTELHFLYGDGTHGHENRHVIEIAGLGIETGPLDANNPEQVVRFVPEKSGRFEFRCVYLCHGHANLQGGVLRVGPPASLTTSVDLMVRESEDVQLVLVASVTDQRGSPVVGAPLHFYVFTKLFDSYVDVGEGVTNGEGDAIVAFIPTVTGETRFQARFEGQDVFEPSEGITRYDVGRADPGPLSQEPHFSVPLLRPWFVLVLVAGVFAVYGAALLRLRGFARR